MKEIARVNPHEEFLLNLRKGYNNIVVSTKCNINCCFCSRLFNPFESEECHRDYNEIVAEINACWPNKLKMINSSISRVTDGEPFTHPRIWEILRHVRARFPFKGLFRLHDKVQITTNGTYLDEDNLLKLAELQGVVLVHSINTTYVYDFGDNWIHEILLEAINPEEEGSKYPKCLAGERACPPEDCGSVPGYYDLLEVLNDPENEEYEDTVAWLKGEVTRYHPFSPEKFDPQAVKFDNPKKRWKILFPQGGNESNTIN